MSADSTMCATCGRVIGKTPRPGQVLKYCSKSCRSNRPNATDRALESVILDLLARRSARSTICPSEAARQVSEDWRPLMERARRAARRLQANRRVEIRQGGRAVDPSTARGPIRVARGPEFDTTDV